MIVCINQYAEHLRHERNASAHTQRNYLSDLAQLQSFLRARELCLDAEGAVDIGKIDIHAVRAFLASLTQQRKKSSIGRKAATPAATRLRRRRATIGRSI